MQLTNNDTGVVETPPVQAPVQQTPPPTGTGDKNQPPQPQPQGKGIKQLIHDAYSAAGYTISDENVEALADKYKDEPLNFAKDFWKENNTPLSDNAIKKIHNIYLDKIPLKVSNFDPKNPNDGRQPRTIAYQKPHIQQSQLNLPTREQTPQEQAANADVQKVYNSLDSETKAKWDKTAQAADQQQPDEINEVTPEQQQAYAEHNTTAGKVADALHLPALNSALEKPLAGLEDITNDAIGKIQSTITGKDYKYKGGLFTDLSKHSQLMDATRPNQNTFADRVLEGVASSVPILATSLLTDGATAESQLGTQLSKTPQLVSHFAKANAINSGLIGYGEARESGNGITGSLEHASTEAVKGLGEGMYMDALGLVGETYGGAIKDRLAKILPKTAEANKNLVHALSTSLTFGAASAATGGDENDIATQMGVGGAFGAHDIFKESKDNLGDTFARWKINSDIAKTNLGNLASQRVKAIFSTPIENIKQVLDMPGSSTDFQVKSLELGLSAAKTKDINEKSSGSVAQKATQNIANIKAVAENIEQDPEAVKKVITESDMPDEAKQAAIEKVDQVTQIQKAAKGKKESKSKGVKPTAVDPNTVANIGDHVVDNNDISHEVIGYGNNGGYLNEFGNEVPKDNVKNVIRNGVIVPVPEPGVQKADNASTVESKAAQPAGTEHITNPLNDELMQLGYHSDDFEKLNDAEKKYIIDKQVVKPKVEAVDAETHKKNVTDIFSKLGIPNPEVHAENITLPQSTVQAKEPVQENEVFTEPEQAQKSEQELPNNIVDEKTSTDAEGQVDSSAGREDGQKVGDKVGKQKRSGSRQKDDKTISPESSQEEVSKDTPSGIEQGEKPETVPDRVHFTREQVKSVASSKPQKGHINDSDLDEKGKLEKKQTIQLVLKKKFNELRGSKPEEVHKSLADFIGRVMDYRRKGFIKGDKSYTEKGSKDTFNGTEHWIDSAVHLAAKSLDVKQSRAEEIVHNMQAEWAKHIDINERDGKLYNKRLEELGKNTDESTGNTNDTKQPEQEPVRDTEPVKEPEPEPVEQPTEEHGSAPAEPIQGEPEADEQVDDKSEEPEVDRTPNESSNTDEDDQPQQEAPEAKDLKDEVDTRLVHVGDDDNGKPIRVRAEDVGDYNKTIDLINKKLQRIEEAKDAGDKAQQQVQEGMLKNQKDKLKQIIENGKKPSKQLIQKDIAENKTVVKNLETQKSNIESASLIERAEAYANDLKKKGSENLKKSRNGSLQMNGGRPLVEGLVGTAQKITGHLIEGGIKTLKTIEGLRKYVKEMILAGKFDKDPLEGSTKTQQENVIKLVSAQLESHYGKEADVADKAKGFLEQNKAEAKKLLKDNRGLTKTGLLKRWFTDRSANLTEGLKRDGSKLINPMSPISESYGDKATRLFYSMSGSGNKATEMYEHAYRSIYGSPLFSGDHFLTEKEQNVLALIINMKRISELDKMRLERNPEAPLLEHPFGMNQVSADNILRDLSDKTPSMVKEFGDYDFNEISKRADKYFDTMQQLLDLRHENGLISEAAYKTMKEAKYYSPRRFLDYINNDVNFKSKNVSTSTGVKSLGDGSEGAYITNPAKLLYDSIGMVHRDIDQNTAYKAMNELLTNVDTEMGRPAKYSRSFIAQLKEHYAAQDEAAKAPTSNLMGVQSEIDPSVGWKYIKPDFESPADGETLFKYYDKGVQKGFIMKNAFADELKGFDQRIPRQAVALWSGARLKQALATGVNTWFAVSNTVRDAGFVLFTTNHYSPVFPVAAAQYAKDWVTHLKDAWTKSGDYKDFVNEGGGREFLGGDPKLFSGEESHVKNGLNEIWYQLGHRLPQTSEIAGRLAVRSRVVENLTNDYKKSGQEITPEVQKEIQQRASFEAANTMDFSQGGTIPKEINSFIPFFNAGILGTRNLTRYATSNPIRFASQLLQLGAVNGLMAAWNYGLIGDQESAKERADYYARYISDNDKSVNHILMLPFAYTDEKGIKRYPYIKIPKPQEQKIFSGLFEHLTLKAYGIEDDYLKSRVRMDAVSLASYIPDGGNFLPGLLAGPAAYMSNHDYFRNKQYYKGPDVIPSAEYGDKTPESYKMIGKALGMSPDRLKGAFEATVPTNNQVFDMVNFAADKMGLGSRGYYRDQENKPNVLDQLTNVSKGLSDGDKNDLHKMISESLNHGGGKRLMGVTTDSPIDENTRDIVLQGNTDKKVMNDEFQDYLKRYEETKDSRNKISENDLEQAAVRIGSDESLGADGATDVVNLMFKAKIAIKGEDASQFAKNIRMASRDPKIQANLYLDQMSKVADPDKKAEYLKQIQDSNMFDKKFFYWLEKLENNPDKK